jgi:hypothetical protein
MRTIAVNTTDKPAGRVAPAVACLLRLPWLARQCTDAVVWGLTDVAVAGALLWGADFTYELVASQAGHLACRAGGVAVAAALRLAWVNLAVGLTGSEDHPANLIDGGVPAVGIMGVFLARFAPRGVARALCATACAQAWAAVSALIAGWGGPWSGPLES